MIKMGLWPTDEVAGMCCSSASVRKAQGPGGRTVSGWGEGPQGPPLGINLQRGQLTWMWIILVWTRAQTQEKILLNEVLMTSFYLFFWNIKKYQALFVQIY